MHFSFHLITLDRRKSPFLTNVGLDWSRWELGKGGSPAQAGCDGVCHQSFKALYSLTIDDALTTYIDIVKNMGIIFYSYLSWGPHVCKISRKVKFFHLLQNVLLLLSQSLMKL